MKEPNRYKLDYHSSLKISKKPLYLFIKIDTGNYVKYRNYKRLSDRNVVLTNKVEQLQARIKELESQSHINEIKAQGIEGMLNDDVFKEHVRYSLKGLDSTEVDDYTYLENVRNYVEQLRTKHD